MKILIVVPALNKGGVERVVSILANEWIKENEVKIVVFDGTKISYSFGVEIVDLKLPTLDGIFFKSLQANNRLIKLTKIFINENPDYIISFMESSNFPCILASFFSGKLNKLFISAHADPAILLKFQRFFIKLLYRYPQKIITVSNGVTQALERLGVPKKKLKVIHNPLPSSVPSINSPLSKPKGSPENYILAVGRLDRQKGFNFLIEAFSKIPFSNFHLVILGEGEERENLQKIILDKGISDRVNLFGLVDDVWPWYRYAKCFVSSSLTESWGNVIIESMSQGCPVVAFDCDYGPREIITNNIDGILVNTKDIDHLASAISDLLSNPDLQKKISHNGLARALKFNPKTLSLKWLD